MVMLRIFGEEGEVWLTQLEFWSYQPVGPEEGGGILIDYLSTGALRPNIVNPEELRQMLVNLKDIVLELIPFISHRNI